MYTHYELLDTHLRPIDRLDGWIIAVFIAAPFTLFLLTGPAMIVANGVLTLLCLYITNAHVRMVWGLKQATADISEKFNLFFKDVYSYGILLTLLIGGLYLCLAWVLAPWYLDDPTVLTSSLLMRIHLSLMMSVVTYLYVVHTAMVTYRGRMLNRLDTASQIHSLHPEHYTGVERRGYRKGG